MAVVPADRTPRRTRGASAWRVLRSMSPRDESSSRQSKTTDASTKQYRKETLAVRKIYFREPGFALDKLPEEIEESIGACATLSFRTTLEDIRRQRPVQDADQIVDAANEILAEVARCLEDGGGESNWREEVWPLVYKSLHRDRSFYRSSSSNDNNWDAPIENPPFWCAGLLRPKPDRAYGFKVPLTHDEPHPLLSLHVLSALEDDAHINLHPRPSPHTLGGLAYPGFVHVVRDENGTPRFAENELAKSLAFALSQQKELREAALAANSSIDRGKYELPVLGVTSIGPMMCIYYAFEGQDEEANIVPYEALHLQQPRHACASLLFVQSAAKWLKSEYRVRILELLDIVYKSHLTRRQAALCKRGLFT